MAPKHYKYLCACTSSGCIWSAMPLPCIIGVRVSCLFMNINNASVPIFPLTVFLYIFYTVDMYAYLQIHKLHSKLIIFNLSDVGFMQHINHVEAHLAPSNIQIFTLTLFKIFSPYRSELFNRLPATYCHYIKNLFLCLQKKY